MPKWTGRKTNKPKKEKNKVVRVLSWVLVAYLLFVLGSCTLPFILQKDVTEAAVLNTTAADYLAGETGPDTALLVEEPFDALAIRLQLVREAQHTLDVAYHTIQGGASTNALLGELLLAADRGVQVRILLDGAAGAMSSDIRKSVFTMAGHENIELRLYNPVKWYKPWEWNALLHDKFFLVDGTSLLLGGRNIGDQYYAPPDYTGRVTYDRDVLVFDTGSGSGESVLRQVEAYWDLLWSRKDTSAAKPRTGAAADTVAVTLRGAAASFAGAHPAYYEDSMDAYRGRALPTNKITLLYNPVDGAQKEPWVGYGLRTLMLSAEQEVALQTPYATNNPRFLDALAASAANVPTAMLTNSVASSPNYPAFSVYSATRKQFVHTGIEIYEYQSHDSIHGKSLVVDRRISAVGSFNMDDRSLRIDTETMLVIDSEPFAESLLAAIEGKMQDQSLVVASEGGYRPGAIEPLAAATSKRILMRVVSLFTRLFRFLI